VLVETLEFVLGAAIVWMMMLVVGFGPTLGLRSTCLIPPADAGG